MKGNLRSLFAIRHPDSSLRALKVISDDPIHHIENFLQVAAFGPVLDAVAVSTLKRLSFPLGLSGPSNTSISCFSVFQKVIEGALFVLQKRTPCQSSDEAQTPSSYQAGTTAYDWWKLHFVQITPGKTNAV